MDVWHDLASKLRQFLRGWGGNRGREAALLKADTLKETVWLDERADTLGISEAEWQRR